ncbi:MAG: hypothetical protein LLF94_00530, partial [Chlamydiales bacterium]|nr:hypothetical protein [Chlamydiales bacterium]
AQNTGPNYTVALPETILTPMQPSNSIGGGDERGVSSDKFGNVWYGTTIAFPNGVFDSYTNQPIFTVSTDGGVTFETTPVYSVPLPNPVPPVTLLYDFPQYCFGGRGDGSGEYGLWFSVDYWENGIDSNPIVGFIPIYGLGSFGLGTEVNLTSLTNVDLIPSITASEDGRVWTQCIPYSGSTYISPIGTIFKSPGELDENYAGPGNIAMINQNQSQWGVTNEVAAPVSGFFNSVQQNVYDDKRQALYSVVTNQVPDYSQNMGIYLSISRDNGQTWSEPLLINNTNFANRGFASMALDTVKGNLVFGWYDGRNDKTYESVEYMAAILPAKTLDKLVDSIPLSNPLYALPSATTPPFATAGVGVMPVDAINKRAERGFGTRISNIP